VKYLFNAEGKWLPPLLCAWLSVAMCRGATFTVTTTADTGAGSFRQAILDSNTNPGTNNIIFQISGSPPFSIIPHTVLPSVGNPAIIDGTTQNGFTGTPVIELNGTLAGGTAAGLQLLSGFSTVRGLVINRFSAQGLTLNGSSNVIQGNYIGTDLTGTKTGGNTSFGIWVMSSGNLIGGTNAGNGNVISGGNDTGIYILSAGGNTIQGNLIGVTATGTKALGNVNNGVVIDGGGSNFVGGTNSTARNVISGNGQSGIYLNSGNTTANLIQGNYIGLDISGGSVLNNTNDGITINGAPGNTIGSALPGGGNVISGNGFSGISINTSAASNNVVLGNFIGTDALGKTALGNQNAGVVVSAAAGNQLGGANAGAGNVISGNKQDGIFLTDGALGNLIQGNLIGLSAAGTNAMQNGFNGISLSGAVSNTIGGSVAGARNVISGNANNGVGILLLGDSGNVVLGNYLGTDVTGNKAVANTQAGVRIQGCSNVIGGILPGGGNVIAGNGQQGVWLVGTGGNVTGNAVQGNLIGLDATGASSLPNGNAGVGVSSAAANQIGGTAAAARNVISANGDAGIFFIGAGTDGNQVQGNFIGTDSSGSLARGNLFEGIYVQDAMANVIGGSTAGAGNVISGNNTRGLWLTNASRNMIQGNFIGTKADGATALGNSLNNIELDVNSTNNTVGGPAAGAGNRIAFAIFAQGFARSGIRVRNGSLNNLISGNSIFSNAELGIDLGAFGVTANVDCETGQSGAANAGQNYPVLSNVYSGTATQIRGTLNSGAGKIYLLQFFSNPSGNALGYGEGRVFLGQTNLTLGAACSSNFTVLLPVSIPAGWVVTATATDPANNTSEFSAWIPVVIVPQLQASAVNPANRQFSLFWTNNGGSYVLQQTLSLTPAVQWTSVTNAPPLLSGVFVLTLPATNNSAFYRLGTQ
jgi:hypothetical protein